MSAQHVVFGQKLHAHVRRIGKFTYSLLYSIIIIVATSPRSHTPWPSHQHRCRFTSHGIAKWDIQVMGRGPYTHYALYLHILYHKL